MEVAAGEKVLAWAATESGVVAGTRSALYLPGGGRIPWEQVEAADWDLDAATLKVSEVGTWGEPRPVVLLRADRARAGSWSWCGSGSRRRWSSSGTSRSAAAAASG